MKERIIFFFLLFFLALFSISYSQEFEIPSPGDDQNNDQQDENEAEIPAADSLPNNGNKPPEGETRERKKQHKKEKHARTEDGQPNPAESQENIPSDSERSAHEAEEDAEIRKAWEDHMVDFIPTDLISFEIESNNKEMYYEIIEDAPIWVRGAYSVSTEDKAEIDFWILNPRNKTTWKRHKRKEGVFFFNATQKGVYSFAFNNHRNSKKISSIICNSSRK